MKVKVEEKGILLPRDLLGDAEEVEIVKEDKRIVVIPLGQGADPISGLGANPVSCGLPDAAAEHDKYLYTPDK